jgi:Tol biopolymer transport system component
MPEGIIEPNPPNNPQDLFPDWSPTDNIITFTHYPKIEANINYWEDAGIYFVDDDGMNLRHFSSNRFNPAWSPDGTELAFGYIEGGSWAIGRIRPDSSGFETIIVIYDLPFVPRPQWSHDGTEIAYDLGFEGGSKVMIVNINTHQTEEFMEKSHSPSWSPVEDLLVFTYNFDPYEIGSIFVANRDGSYLERVTFPLRIYPLPEEIGGNHEYAKISPDGEWIAFHRRDFRHSGIYLIEIDGENESFLTLGKQPDWSPDGMEIVFSRELIVGEKLFIIDRYSKEERQITF